LDEKEGGVMKNSSLCPIKKVVFIWTQSNTCPPGYVPLDVDVSSVPRFIRKMSSPDKVGNSNPTHQHTVSAHYHTGNHSHTVNFVEAFASNGGDAANMGYVTSLYTVSHNHYSVVFPQSATLPTYGDFLLDGSAAIPAYADVLYCKKVS
jgi:hypothetical protein